MNKTKEEIIHKASSCFIELGFRQTTLREIARRCNKPPSHIKYYFKDTNEIFIEIFKLMTLSGIKLAHQYSIQAKNDKERLIAYLEAMLDWIGLNKNYQIMWMMFSHQIIHDSTAKEIFKQALAGGLERIMHMIKPLTNENIDLSELEAIAQNIQTLIIGTLYRISTYDNYGPHVRTNLSNTVLTLLSGTHS